MMILGLIFLVACGQSTQASSAVRPTGTPLTVVAAATVVGVDPSGTEPPPVQAQPTTSALEPVRPTALTVAVRQQIFDEVWILVNEYHLYAADPDSNWLAVREEFAPQIADTTDTATFYNLLNTMLARLNDQHSRILPPTEARQEDVRTSGRAEQVGIGVITLRLDDGLLIQHVFPDSPAARAGLRPRDRIVAIDGEPFTQGSLEGDVGSLVRLMIQRPGAESRDVALNRKAVVGQIGPTVQRLAGDVGYLGLSTLWVNDMADQAATGLAALEAERPLQGVIIDLRSNPGGWRNVLTGILAHFVRGPTGEFFSRQQRIPLEIAATSEPDLRGRPVVVLIDEGTASYAELLAGILQQEADAVVIGMPSAGNTETIYAHDLTSGARLWLAQEGFRLRNGVNLEGVGVRPDILLTDDWTRFSEAEDPGILLGLNFIRNPPGK